MAACLLLTAVFLFMNAGEQRQDDGDDYDYCGPPHFEAGEITYVDSGYGDAVTEELPDGFVKAGTVSFPGGYQNCSYYLNPDVPEWAYVYLIVHTDGTVDETGSLVYTPLHHAYARFVDERLRGNDFICYNGTYYMYMHVAEWYGDDPDVSREDYERIDSQYGILVEGAVPEGFVYAGRTAFTGHDTIPTGSLASNREEAGVYYDPDDPAVILFGNHGYVLDENGHTQHDGFDVYIRYCGSLIDGD